MSNSHHWCSVVYLVWSVGCLTLIIGAQLSILFGPLDVSLSSLVLSCLSCLVCWITNSHHWCSVVYLVWSVGCLTLIIGAQLSILFVLLDVSLSSLVLCCLYCLVCWMSHSHHWCSVVYLV